jgi:flagellar operon protein
MAEPFRAQLDRVNGAQIPNQPRPAQNGRPVQGASFAQTMAQVAGGASPNSVQGQDVRFSNHAQKRLETRDIQLSPENVSRLSGAIDKAEKRGGKSSLVLVDDLAFVVNVRERLVVTAMDANQRGEGVFTQIDSVVFADPASNKTVDHKG